MLLVCGVRGLALAARCIVGIIRNVWGGENIVLFAAFVLFRRPRFGEIYAKQLVFRSATMGQPLVAHNMMSVVICCFLLQKVSSLCYKPRIYTVCLVCINALERTLL